jgi:hypothetical protein
LHHSARTTDATSAVYAQNGWRALPAALCPRLLAAQPRQASATP